MKSKLILNKLLVFTISFCVCKSYGAFFINLTDKKLMEDHAKCYKLFKQSTQKKYKNNKPPQKEKLNKKLYK